MTLTGAWVPLLLLFCDKAGNAFFFNMEQTFYTDIRNKNYQTPKKSFWRSLFSELEDFLDAPDVYLLYSVQERKKLLSLVRGDTTLESLYEGHIIVTVNDECDIEKQLLDFVNLLKQQGYDIGRVFFYKHMDECRRTCEYIYDNGNIM